MLIGSTVLTTHTHTHIQIQISYLSIFFVSSNHSHHYFFLLILYLPNNNNFHCQRKLKITIFNFTKQTLNNRQAKATTTIYNNNINNRNFLTVICWSLGGTKGRNAAVVVVRYCVFFCIDNATTTTKEKIDEKSCTTQTNKVVVSYCCCIFCQLLFSFCFRDFLLVLFLLLTGHPNCVRPFRATQCTVAKMGRRRTRVTPVARKMPQTNAPNNCGDSNNNNTNNISCSCCQNAKQLSNAILCFFVVFFFFAFLLHVASYVAMSLSHSRKIK